MSILIIIIINLIGIAIAQAIFIYSEDESIDYFYSIKHLDAIIAILFVSVLWWGVILVVLGICLGKLFIRFWCWCITGLIKGISYLGNKLGV